MQRSEAIHRVWIHGAAPDRNLMALDEFLELAPELRARLVVEGTVDFIDPSGYVVPLGEALEELRDSWVPARPAPASRQSDVGLSAVPRERRESGARTTSRNTDDVDTRPMRVPSDRRRHVRHQVVRPLRVYREDNPNERVGVAQDVSDGGIRFRSLIRYQVGDRLIVGWCSSLGGTDETWRRGVVVRSDVDAMSPTRVFPRSVAIAFDQEAAA